MKVEVKLSKDVNEPYAIIHTSSITSEIQKIISILGEDESIIAVNDGEKIIVLQREDIYMVRVEMSEVIVHCKDKKYKSKKRLYEIGDQLGCGFMQISKHAFINLKQVQCVEPFFNGMMSLKLKNGTSEYISRKYLPAFKKYLRI